MTALYTLRPVRLISTREAAAIAYHRLLREIDQSMDEIRAAPDTLSICGCIVNRRSGG